MEDESKLCKNADLYEEQHTADTVQMLKMYIFKRLLCYV